MKDECTEYRNVSQTVDIRIAVIRCVVIVPAEFSSQTAISCEMHLDMNVGTLSGLPVGETVFWHGIPFAGSPQKCSRFEIPEIQTGNRVRIVAGVLRNIFSFVLRT